MRALGLAIASLFVTSCFASQTETCGDTLCPPGTRCAPDGASCVLQAQVDACQGQPDGAACTFGNATGGCVGGVCMPSGCGDGRLDPSEECEGADLGGATCATLGYYRGTL